MTRWTVACQTSLAFTISQSLLKIMSIESMMPSSAAPSRPSLNLAQHRVFFQDLSHSSPKYMLLSHPKQRRSLLVQDLMLGGWFRVLPHLSVLTLSSFYCPSLWTHTAPVPSGNSQHVQYLLSSLVPGSHQWTSVMIVYPCL